MAVVAVNVGTDKPLTVSIPDFENWDAGKQADAIKTIGDANYQDSYGHDLQQSAHNAAAGLGSTADTLGGVVARNGYPETGGAISSAGKAVAGAVPAVQGYSSPSSRIAAALKAGDYAGAASLLPHAAAEGSADLAANIGAGAVGGLPAIVGYNAARSLGENAQARAANNNEAAPDTGDVIGAIPGTLAQGVLQAAGVGRVPGVRSAIAAAPGLLRPVAKIAAEGLGAAGADAAGQAGTSAGTDAGLTVDPYRAAATGLQGAAGRAVGEGAGLARDAAGGASRAVQSRLQPAPVSDDQALSQARVGALFQRLSDQAEATKGDTSPLAVLNAAKGTIKSRLLSYAQDLQDRGSLDKTDMQAVRTVIDQAARHNNSAIEGDTTLFDSLNDLGLPSGQLKPLKDGIRDLDTVSPGSFLKNTTGPFQQIGNVVAQVGAVGGSLAHGNIPAAVGAAVGHGLVGKTGGLVGAAVDRALGTNTPTVLLQAQRANRYLRGRELDAGPDTLQALQDAQVGLPPVPAPPEAAAKPPPFIRPAAVAPDQVQPATAPGFIRPDTTPTPAAPAPGFIRPDVPQPPAPAPAPPFIRPQPAPPEPLGPGQPDPATGLPPSPIPPGVPIKAPRPTPPGLSPLPALKLDTPSTIRAALAEADRAMGNAPPLPPAGPLAQHTPSTSYLTGGTPGVTPQHAVDMTNSAISAGLVHPDMAQHIRTGKPIDPGVARIIQNHAKSQVGVPPDAGGVRNPLSYQANLRQEAATATSIVAAHPELAGAVNAIRGASASEKTVASRRAALAAHLATLPPAEAQRQSAILAPLTNYGKK